MSLRLRLAKPSRATPTIVKNLTEALTRDGQYAVVDHLDHWSIQRRRQPPAMLEPLPLRITRHGVIGGKVLDLEGRLAYWPSDLPIGGLRAAGALEHLEEMEKEPADPLEWIRASRAARAALAGAYPSEVPNVAARVAGALFRWFPDGQMYFWLRNPAYMAAERLVHLIGSAELIGADSIAEALGAADAKTFWLAGEDVYTSHPGPMFLDILPIGTSGFCFDTVPLLVLFEFGSLVDWEPLDVLAAGHLHSLTHLRYAGPDLLRDESVVQPSATAVDALRTWFVASYNRLADGLVRLENYRTASGLLRPVVQLQANMTVGRILDTTAHLLASRDLGARQLAFWDLVDLYAGLLGDPGSPLRISGLLNRPFFQKQVLRSIAGIPGEVSGVIHDNAQRLYGGWVDDLVKGVIQPTRVTARHVLVGTPSQRLSQADFFAAHLAARRNTLHGYHPRNPNQFRKYLAIHDGRMPATLPEWGRLAFIALLGRSSTLLRHYRRLG